MQEEVEARHKENDAQASKLEDEKEALLANKDKIERQLRIIHDLLTDPLLWNDSKIITMFSRQGTLIT